MLGNRRGTGVIPRRPGFGTAFLPSHGALRPLVGGMRSLYIDIGMPADKRSRMEDLRASGAFSMKGAKKSRKGVPRRVVVDDGNEEEEKEEPKVTPGLFGGDAEQEEANGGSSEEDAEMTDPDEDEEGSEEEGEDEEEGGEEEGEDEEEDEEEGGKKKKKRALLKLDQFKDDEGAQAIINKYTALQNKLIEAGPQPKTEPARVVYPDTPLGKAQEALAEAKARTTDLQKRKKEAGQRVTAAQKGGEGYPQLGEVYDAKEALEEARTTLDSEQAKEPPDEERLKQLRKAVDKANTRFENAEKAFTKAKEDARAESTALGGLLEDAKKVLVRAEAKVRELGGTAAAAPKATKSKATGKQELNNRVRALRYKMDDELRAYRDAKKEADKEAAEEKRIKEQKARAKKDECYELVCHIHLLREEFLNFYEEKCKPVLDLLMVHNDCAGDDEEEWTIPAEDVEWFRTMSSYILDCQTALKDTISSNEEEWRVERHAAMMKDICGGYKEEQGGKQSWTNLKDEPVSDEEEGEDGEMDGFIDDSAIVYEKKRTQLQNDSRFDRSYMKGKKFDEEQDRQERDQVKMDVDSKALAKQLGKAFAGQLAEGADGGLGKKPPNPKAVDANQAGLVKQKSNRP